MQRVCGCSSCFLYFFLRRGIAFSVGESKSYGEKERFMDFEAKTSLQTCGEWKRLVLLCCHTILLLLHARFSYRTHVNQQRFLVPHVTCSVMLRPLPLCLPRTPIPLAFTRIAPRGLQEPPPWGASCPAICCCPKTSRNMGCLKVFFEVFGLFTSRLLLQDPSHLMRWRGKCF